MGVRHDQHVEFTVGEKKGKQRCQALGVACVPVCAGRDSKGRARAVGHLFSLSASIHPSSSPGVLACSPTCPGTATTASAIRGNSPAHGLALFH